MDGLTLDPRFLRHMARHAPAGAFGLVDIGCAGGIDWMWRTLGARLYAVGVDPQASEVERLTAREPHPHVRYFPGFAVLPSEHPFAQRKATAPDWQRNPWSRLAVGQPTTATRTKSPAAASPASPPPAGAAAPAPDVWSLDALIEKAGLPSVDFIKIDVDGKDFDLLNGALALLDRRDVLGVGIEVNFFGSEAATDNTFHNVDRLMKAQGFELFGLTVRRYAMAALPARYTGPMPGPGLFGRPLQGDALYLRDLAAPEQAGLLARLSADKIINLLCLFSAFDLPDCAAELISVGASRLPASLNVDAMRDCLAAQAQPTRLWPRSYKDYVARHYQGGAANFGSRWARARHVLRLARLDPARAWAGLKARLHPAINRGGGPARLPR